MLYPSVCRRFVAFFFLLSSFVLANYAQSGSLDPSFGRGDGYVQHAFPSSGNGLGTTVVQPDGKLLIARGGYFVHISRYNVDGSLDTSFNLNGEVAYELTNFLGSVKAMALQSDGKIVICGQAITRQFNYPYPPESRFSSFVMRLNADGGRDETFGTGGRVFFDHGNNTQQTFMNALVVTPEGKIIVTGVKQNKILLVQFNSDGSLDPTFGTISETTGNRTEGNTIMLAPDGKIVVGGCNHSTSYSNYLVARYDRHGAPDLTLNGTGLGGVYGPGCVASLALEPDGDMILSSPGFTERLKPTGPRDTTFNNVGYMYLGGKTARQADGKILIISSGSPGPGQPTGLITRRFNEDGTRDTTFGDQSIGGIIFIPSSTATEFFLRDNGRLLVVANNPASITQYLADGSPDPTFASQGAYTNAGSRESSVSAVFSLPDGKTLAAGGHGLMRFQENGDLDTTFGELGKVTVFETVDRYKLVPAAMQADGKILMANDYPGASEYARKISVRRFQPDGSKDTSFGLNGQIEITSDVPYEDVVAIKMQPDGKILVAARSYQGSSPTLVVFRLDQSGHYDSTFSGDGIAVIPGLGINDLTLQADGKIVGVGGFGYSNLVSFRLLENGELDQAFGTAGKVPISLASANAIALQSDGKIVIGGTDVLLIRSWDFTLTRLNPNGTRDTGFGVDGFANIAVTNRFDEVKVLRVLPDDRILAVGYSGDQYTPNGAANNDFTIVRLEPSGAIDQTWGNQGIATADLLGGDVPYAMDIDSAGRIVVGGESHVRFTVARFLTARTTFSVSGRVVDPAMRGIRAASVVLTDSQGVSRTVTTSTFGYFAFENVPGGTITISVNSRRYRFTSQKLSLADDLTELLFEGSE